MFFGALFGLYLAIVPLLILAELKRQGRERQVAADKLCYLLQKVIKQLEYESERSSLHDAGIGPA